jgi:hypothetical protein
MSEHELFELKAIADSLLIPLGFEPQPVVSHPEVFGSYYCLYSKSDFDIRFIWDGKDGWGYLEAKPPHEESWKTFSSHIPEDRSEIMKALATSTWPQEVADAIRQYAT